MDQPAPGPLEGPPADPEEWTDDQWLTWLQATDPVPRPDPTPPVTSVGRLTHTSGGFLLGQAMLGLATAIYGPKDDEVVVVIEDDSDPEMDDCTVHLDHEHPERSTVVFRHRPDPSG